MKTMHENWSETGINEAPSLSDSSIMKQLPNLLRFLGASALIIAMYSFLANGWQTGNDLLQYLLMLGHTGLLAAVGLLSGHWLKEGKGARLLLTLALVSVPVNFAILGAFIVSQTSGFDLSSIPQYVTWSVGSLDQALMTGAGAMLLLIPVTMLGFTVLARGMSKKLSALFLVSNMALLLPVREPVMISMLVIGLILSIVYFSSRAAHEQTTAKTHEGIIALCLQLLPVAVLLGRTLWLYSADLFLMTVMTMTIYFTLRQLSLYFTTDSRIRSVLNGLSTIPAIMIAPQLTIALFESQLIGDALFIPISAMIAAIMFFDIAKRSKSNSTAFHQFATAGLVVSFIGNLWVYSNALAALTCIIVGLGLIIFGYKQHTHREFTAGIVIMMSGIIQQLYEIIHHFDLSSWAILAILGLVSIVVASTIESGGGKLKPRIESLKQNFNQ